MWTSIRSLQHKGRFPSSSDHACTPGFIFATPTAILPLVLVHGLLDSPAVFNGLKRELGGGRQPLLIPALPLRLGRTSVLEAAQLLGSHIEEAFGPDEPLDLLGFSIGGVIARCWIQLLGGHRRTRRFVSVGSPQQGTLTALPWPGRIFSGIADLRTGSTLLEQLNSDLDRLRRIECHSFYSALDLAVLPGWRAVLPVGARTMLPVLTHPQLLRDQAALEPLARELLRP
jgi:triacylglycerol lipase